MNDKIRNLDVNQPLANQLKAARKRLGFSQSDVSRLSGVPQSRISMMENNDIDCRVSSLIAVARAVKLDVMLVPALARPAVNAIVRGRLGQTDSPAQPAYRLDDDGDDDE